jgi:putative SOS response-associated peptidase YedK
MCGRFTITITIGLPERFGISRCECSLIPRYNIAPSQQVPVIIHPVGSGRECHDMIWGLIPSGTKDPAKKSRLINARAKTLHERASFRTLLGSRRCIIPATGFFEWVKKGRESIPYYIHREDESLFGFAGLYDFWKSPEGKLLKTFSIITTRPNALTARYHDRMPAMLLPEHESPWLDSGSLSPEETEELLSPYPEEYLTAFRVSRAVNDPRSEGATLIRRENDSALPFS